MKGEKVSREVDAIWEFDARREVLKTISSAAFDFHFR